MSRSQNPREKRVRNAPNDAIRRYLLGEDAVEHEWESRPELPTSDEIMGTDESEKEGDIIQLIPNQITGPWPSKNTYLKGHYELLREDSVAPLRDAVAYARDNPHMMDSSIVAIYEKVYIIGLTFTNNGLATKIQFSTARAGKNVVWKRSKRLIGGSIVALSPAYDHFRSQCVVAVVAARPLEEVEKQPHEIDIYVARAEDTQLDTQQEWVMVEARSGYYESNRYTMTALQKMAKESFPLSEHICSLNPCIEPPEYVTTSPVFDISPALSSNTRYDNVDVLESWPEMSSDDFDVSQWNALHHVLAKRLAIVQGPPGTGKTHVSVAALKILLSTMQDADPPVVVAAQTNHALDQLLNRISQFEENYIRLGRRSTDTNIKKKTLFEFRQKVRLADLPSGLLVAAKKELHNITEEASRLLRPFNAENSDTPLPASFFLANDLISSAQYSKLQKGAEGWICSGSADKEDPMAIWLGDSVVEFKIDYKEENLGLAKEVDLDDIPEKEPETDVVFGDEESEALRGTLISIKEGLVGRGGLAALERVTKENFVKLQDLWKVPPKFRGGVYNALRKHAIDKVIAKLRKLIARYNEACLKHKAGKWEIDYVYLKRAKVIGMTTTGLSKYRGLIACLRPKIIMIEEAAEVIEAPIAAACVESLEHLILVGDHKQLQGRCAVRALEGEPFFLNISMFERLAHNGMEFKTLTVQRRMAPEISALLTPIYGQLEDHPSVKEYDKVSGKGDIRSFFFCHRWPEESDDHLSKFNEYEAQMVVRFILYLVLNGILVGDITVLTFYNGQRKRLLSLLSRLKYLRDQVFKVATVDSYQGEENDVVILSLVRSNEKIGFLSDEHRVCVALSRAKRGFYIFGNGQSLALDPLWWDVIKIMDDGGERPRRLGFKLPLTCEKHGKMMFIHDLAQWDTINGGCDRFCGEVLSCGHECSLRCHSFPHDQVICNKTCNKRLPCGHICRGPCSKDRPCSCPCGAVIVEEIEEKVDVWEGSNNEVISIVSSSSEDPVISNEKDHAEFIKNYRDFANGGAKKQDAVLNERAKAMASEEMQKILDEEAFNDLFGSNTREKKKAPNRMTPAVKRVGIDGTKRERYVDYFNSDATPSKARKYISSGGNLLDTE